MLRSVIDEEIHLFAGSKVEGFAKMGQLSMSIQTVHWYMCRICYCGVCLWWCPIKFREADHTSQRDSKFAWRYWQASQCFFPSTRKDSHTPTWHCQKHPTKCSSGSKFLWTLKEQLVLQSIYQTPQMDVRDRVFNPEEMCVDPDQNSWVWRRPRILKAILWSTQHFKWYS